MFEFIFDLLGNLLDEFIYEKFGCFVSLAVLVIVFIVIIAVSLKF